MTQQSKTVPVERSYDMRVKALIAFNTCKGDRDDALQAAWEATLAAAPQPSAEPVATKLETQQFNCFHVSAEDFNRLKTLPAGTKLYAHAPDDTALIQQALDALERAQAGLQWYQDSNPEQADGSDDEANAELDKAIAALQARLGERT